MKTQLIHEKGVLLLKIMVLKKTYAPLLSFALGLSSCDRHRLHRSARTAFDAPQCMHIFLRSNRFSASGNFAICYRLFLVYPGITLSYLKIIVVSTLLDDT